jgi:hypothetical protein
LVVLLLYAYCVGIPSSRRIERACWEDAVFRVLTGNQQPDHSRNSDFRLVHLDALAGLFVQVLRPKATGAPENPAARGGFLLAGQGRGQSRGLSSRAGRRQVRQLPSPVATSTPINSAAWWASASGSSQAIASAIASSRLIEQQAEQSEPALDPELEALLTL